MRLVPIWPRVSAHVPAALAPQPWAERRHRHFVGISAHVENPVVITAATKTPRGERAHAVGAHVAEGHGRCVLHWLSRSHEIKAVTA